MSTRSTVHNAALNCADEVSTDAASFYMEVARPAPDFGSFDLAKSRSSDNPVYYVQYAHARICSVFLQLRDGPAPQPRH